MTKGQFRILVVLTVVFGFLGGAASVLLLRGAPAVATGTLVQEEVRAKRFVLVDDAGNEQGLWGLLYDAAGKPQSGSPGLGLCDAAGRLRVDLALASDGSPHLALNDAEGKARAALGLASDGSPNLHMYDPAGKMRAQVFTDADGRPDISLFDADGKQRLGMTIGAEGPALGLFDADGKQRLGMMAAAEGPVLGLFKRNGDLLWGAP